MRMAASGPWTILLVATKGLAHFVENCLIGIRSCGIDLGIVQVVIPRNAAAELLPLLTSFGAKGRFCEDILGEAAGAFPDRYVEYGTDAFRRLIHLRFLILRTILQEGNRVVYADLDVAWLRNPLPYLGEVLERYAWALQTEPVAAFPPLFCIGFFALNPNPISLGLIEAHERNAVARFGSSISNQELFRSLFLEKPERTELIFPLPESLFPAGLLFRLFVEAGQDPAVMVARLQPFVFHANWTIGLQEKRQLLSAARCWWVGDAS
jgi:hypothetical protein